MRKYSLSVRAAAPAAEETKLTIEDLGLNAEMKAAQDERKAAQEAVQAAQEKEKAAQAAHRGGGKSGVSRRDRSAGSVADGCGNAGSAACHRVFGTRRRSDQRGGILSGRF